MVPSKRNGLSLIEIIIAALVVIAAVIFVVVAFWSGSAKAAAQESEISPTHYRVKASVGCTWKTKQEYKKATCPTLHVAPEITSPLAYDYKTGSGFKLVEKQMFLSVATVLDLNGQTWHKFQANRTPDRDGEIREEYWYGLAENFDVAHHYILKEDRNCMWRPTKDFKHEYQEANCANLYTEPDLTSPLVKDVNTRLWYPGTGSGYKIRTGETFEVREIVSDAEGRQWLKINPRPTPVYSGRIKEDYWYGLLDDFEKVAFDRISPENDAIKHADLNRKQQLLYLKEGDQVVRVIPVSTGGIGHTTPAGDFLTGVIFPIKVMEPLPGSGEGYLYFSGFAVQIKTGSIVRTYGHSGYWNAYLGILPLSHGCVNQSGRDALWFYNWAPPHMTVHIK